MTLSLNMLNHLGINLYGNLPAVLPEAVANAWDADATEVAVTVDAPGPVHDRGVQMISRISSDTQVRTVGGNRRDTCEMP